MTNSFRIGQLACRQFFSFGYQALSSSLSVVISCDVIYIPSRVYSFFLSYLFGGSQSVVIISISFYTMKTLTVTSSTSRSMPCQHLGAAAPYIYIYFRVVLYTCHRGLPVYCVGLESLDSTRYCAIETFRNPMYKPQTLPTNTYSYKIEVSYGKKRHTNHHQIRNANLFTPTPLECSNGTNFL